MRRHRNGFRLGKGRCRPSRRFNGAYRFGGGGLSCCLAGVLLRIILGLESATVRLDLRLALFFLRLGLLCLTFLFFAAELLAQASQLG